MNRSKPISSNQTHNLRTLPGRLEIRTFGYVVGFGTCGVASLLIFGQHIIWLLFFAAIVGLAVIGAAYRLKDQELANRVFFWGYALTAVGAVACPCGYLFQQRDSDNTLAALIHQLDDAKKEIQSKEDEIKATQADCQSQLADSRAQVEKVQLQLAKSDERLAEGFGKILAWQEQYQRAGIPKGSVLPLVGPASESVEQTFNRGNDCFKQSDMDGAITAFTEVIRLDPKNANAYCNLGMAYSMGMAYTNKFDADKGITYFNEALRLDPKLAAAYYGRGQAYATKGEYDKGIAELTEAIRLDPNYAEAYAGRGQAYYNKGITSGDGDIASGKKGEWDKVIADTTEAIRLAPTNARLPYYIRGQAYEKKGEWDKAIADYTENLRLDPADLISFYILGIAYSHKGEYDKGIAYFTEWIRLHPDDSVGYIFRAEAYKAKGDKAKSDEDINHVKEIIGFTPLQSGKPTPAQPRTR